MMWHIKCKILKLEILRWLKMYISVISLQHNYNIHVYYFYCLKTELENLGNITNQRTNGPKRLPYILA